MMSGSYEDSWGKRVGRLKVRLFRSMELRIGTGVLWGVDMVGQVRGQQHKRAAVNDISDS